jgi:hypothetical protein
MTRAKTLARLTRAATRRDVARFTAPFLPLERLDVPPLMVVWCTGG